MEIIRTKEPDNKYIFWLAAILVFFFFSCKSYYMIEYYQKHLDCNGVCLIGDTDISYLRNSSVRRYISIHVNDFEKQTEDSIKIFNGSFEKFKYSNRYPYRLGKDEHLGLWKLDGSTFKLNLSGNRTFEVALIGDTSVFIRNKERNCFLLEGHYINTTIPNEYYQITMDKEYLFPYNISLFRNDKLVQSSQDSIVEIIKLNRKEFNNKFNLVLVENLSELDSFNSVFVWEVLPMYTSKY